LVPVFERADVRNDNIPCDLPSPDVTDRQHETSLAGARSGLPRSEGGVTMRRGSASNYSDHIQ
jgi:hypothetical protein